MRRSLKTRLPWSSQDSLKADRGVIRAAIQADPWQLEHASEELGDATFVLEALVLNGFVLMHASEALRADKRCVLAAVRKNGQS